MAQLRVNVSFDVTPEETVVFRGALQPFLGSYPPGRFQRDDAMHFHIRNLVTGKNLSTRQLDDLEEALDRQEEGIQKKRDHLKESRAILQGMREALA